MVDPRAEYVAAFRRRAEREQSAEPNQQPSAPRTRGPDDPWPMNVISHEEAEAMYEQRRRFVSGEKIAAEFGKALRSVERAIGYISVERETYGYTAWRKLIREHKSACWQRKREQFDAANRQERIAKQSALEHAAMVELQTRAALAHSLSRETRAEREQRVERELLSGTVPIAVSGDGDRNGERRERAPLPLSASEREARKRARRIRAMLGPTATREELGL